MQEKKIFTDSDIEIRKLYADPVPINEKPGEFPFTRGVQSDMYRGKLWTMRQYAGEWKFAWLFVDGNRISI